MAVPQNLQPPDWIHSGAQITSGLDLLGLRLPVQFIGGTLLDGVTTVTPSVRYLAFRAWLIHRYGQTGQADDWQTYTDFAARIESALVLGNPTQDRTISGLIGADQALLRLDANTSRVEVSALVKSPASTIYTGPSDQLGLSRTRDNLVPALIDTRGLPLALVVQQCLVRIPLLERLVSEPNLTQVALDDLRELGAVARIDQIPDDERELLLAAIVPAQPLPKERARVGTYAALLSLAARMKTRPTESHLFDTACSMSRFSEPLLDQVADGWTFYCVRDAIAVTQEAVLAAVMGEIMASEEGGLAGVARETVVGALMERVEEHDAALRDLGFGSGRPNKPKGDAPASPVHPADLVVHLEESHDGLQNFGSARPGSLSLTGILRLLFDAEAEEIADSVATKDEEIGEGQLPGDEKSHQKKISEKVALTPAYSTLLSCRRRPDGDAAAGGNRFRVEASLGG